MLLLWLRKNAGDTTRVEQSVCKSSMLWKGLLCGVSSLPTTTAEETPLCSRNIYKTLKESTVWEDENVPGVALNRAA
jgi:hypothetical protein